MLEFDSTQAVGIYKATDKKCSSITDLIQLYVSRENFKSQKLPHKVKEIDDQIEIGLYHQVKPAELWDRIERLIVERLSRKSSRKATYVKDYISNESEFSQFKASKDQSEYEEDEEIYYTTDSFA